MGTIRLHSCRRPALFEVNDFTAHGATTSRGDGKNPGPHRIVRQRLGKCPRFPAAVLLRSAIRKPATAKLLPGTVPRL